MPPQASGLVLLALTVEQAEWLTECLVQVMRLARHWDPLDLTPDHGNAVLARLALARTEVEGTIFDDR